MAEPTSLVWTWTVVSPPADDDHDRVAHGLERVAQRAGGPVVGVEQVLDLEAVLEGARLAHGQLAVGSAHVWRRWDAVVERQTAEVGVERLHDDLEAACAGVDDTRLLQHRELLGGPGDRRGDGGPPAR